MSEVVSVDVDTAEVDIMLDLAIKKISEFPVVSLHELAEDIIAEAKSNIQQNRSIMTGELLGSIRILEEKPGSVFVGTDAGQAWYIEYGRGEVKPVTKKTLHFINKDGEEIFTKHAAPTEPMPFFEPAIVTAIDNFIERKKDFLE